MKKSRSTLKEYFQKGKIPTESNFADLIDSMLNQEEDHVLKLPNDPLSIKAIGEDESLINFYSVKDEKNPTWQIKQNPDNKPGLSIHDASGIRFFIQSGTGNVGIGTTEPEATLDVKGTVRALGDWDNNLIPDKTYQAPSDGFVVANIKKENDGARGYIEGKTDEKQDPTTVRAYAAVHYWEQCTWISHNGFMMPVKKHDFWKVSLTITCMQCTVTINWIPLGHN